MVKNSLNFKLGFFIYFQYISGDIIRKNILRSDYHSARWYWCKKDQKNLLQASHNIFPQCLIVNSSLLWAFMVQNFCKNSFSGGKSRKNGIPVIKITFSLQKIPQNYRFPWVNINILSILADLILLIAVVFSLWDVSFHYFIYKFIEINRNNCIKNTKMKPWYVLKSSAFKSFQLWSNCLKLKNKLILVSA